MKSRCRAGEVLSFHVGYPPTHTFKYHTAKHPTTGVSVTLNGQESCACQVCQSVLVLFGRAISFTQLLHWPPGLMKPPNMNIFANSGHDRSRPHSWFSLNQPFD